MALVRWNPRQAFNLNREIDDLVNRFWGDWNPGNGKSQGRYPSVDVEETDDQFVFTAELPGMDRNDIQVSLHDGVLKIEGEKKRASEKKEQSFYRSERIYGRFSRSFQLGSKVDAEKVDASYKDGVLTLTVAKAEAAKPKQIEVKVS
ncbi:MAG: Hsp20/alpha crystallin family protein [bacterium]|nr:Hsp20/alpha crystallin family protein [bacterium]